MSRPVELGIDREVPLPNAHKVISLERLAIEHGIQIPPRRGRSGLMQNTMSAMNVGDSFVTTESRRGNIYSNATVLGLEFVTRCIDKEKKLLRAWRVK